MLRSTEGLLLVKSNQLSFIPLGSFIILRHHHHSYVDCPSYVLSSSKKFKQIHQQHSPTNSINSPTQFVSNSKIRIPMLSSSLLLWRHSWSLNLYKLNQRVETPTSKNSNQYNPDLIDTGQYFNTFTSNINIRY